MKKDNYDKIRLRIVVAICVGVMLTTIIGIVISRSVVQHFDKDNLARLMDMSQAMYQQSLVDDTETLSGVITLLRKDRSLQDLFVTGDREGLLEQSQDVFTELRESHRITHFYYHTTNGQNFLRVHAASRHGDQIDRATMRAAMASGKLASGIELGPLGTFTLRVVVPWLRNGELIGYLELGEEVDHITRKIAVLMRVDLVLVLHKEKTTEQGWTQGQQLMGRSANWNLLQKHALLNTSFSEIPQTVITYLQTIIDPEDARTTDVLQVTPSVLASSRTLKDIGGNDVGNFIILVNNSDSNRDLREASIQYVTYSLLLLTLLMVGYWAYLGRIEKSIHLGKEKLSNTLAEQRNDRETLENILSSMAEGFLLTMPSGKRITQVNTKMKKMLALPEKEILGRLVSDFITDETLSVAREMIEMLNQGQQARGELMLVNSQQERIPCLVSASPLLDAEGEVIGSFSSWSDISDYKNTLDRLLETEENFNIVFYHAPDAFSMLKDEIIIDCNEAFIKMFGAASKDQLMNVRPASLSPEKQADGQLSQDKATAMSVLAIAQGFHRFEWLYRKLSGEIFPVEVSLTALQNNGEIEIHCRCKDLSEQKKYEQNLKQAVADAQVASRSKDEFLANMSHEIRTPMNGIIGLTRLTLDTILTKKQHQMLENVLYSAENLLGLLNDILDFSKIEAGQLSLECHNFSLEAMLDHLISTLSFQAQEKQLFLKNISDHTSLPQFIKTDELRLRQIIINLAGNGIKFTQTGGVTIKAEVDEQNEDDFVIHFSIQDSGIGIPLEKQDAVFNTFTQADTSTARKFGGTGLGLSITRQLVELMDGRIWIESGNTQGTTFHFTVRVERGNAEQYQRNQSANLFPLNALKVLLVEDNTFNQDIAVAVFEKQGHQVKVADNGMEALELLLKENFDVVFMDVQMPVLDGLITTAIIRDCEAKRLTGYDEIAAIEGKLIKKLAGNRIPIIAMTANAMSGDRQKCLDAGMDEYLTKPFIPENIHDVLHLLFQNAKIVKKEDQEQTTDANMLEDQCIDSLSKQVVNHMKTVYGMDTSKAEKMLQGAVATLKTTIDIMAGAIEEQKYPVLQKTAHSTKGVLLNMGLKQLGEQAASIEQAAGKGVMNNENCGDFIADIRSFIANAQGNPDHD